MERLFASYESRCDEVRRELALSEGKLRDFEARLGATFPHERYIEELSALRDELKVALSATPQEGAEPKTRTAGRALGTHQGPQGRPRGRGGAGEATGGGRQVGAARHGTDSEEGGSRPGRWTSPPSPPKGRGERRWLPRAKESPALAPLVPKPVAHAPREGRRRRYQKWMF